MYRWTQQWRRLGTRFGGHSPTIDVTSSLAHDWVLMKLPSFEMSSVPSGSSKLPELKGEKEIGDKINKIMRKLAEANDFRGRFQR